MQTPVDSRPLSAAASTQPRSRQAAFLAWSPNDRSLELALAFDASCHIVYLEWLVRPFLVPVRYVLSSVATAWFLVRKRPAVVVATNPPMVLALIAEVYAWLFGGTFLLDDHPGGFGRRGRRLWTLRAPLQRHLVRRARTTIVASSELAQAAIEWGGTPVIVHEAPPLWSLNEPPHIGPLPTVLWPSVFADDEPVAEVLSAARALSRVRFLITGDVLRCPSALRESASANVEFAGYWRRERFWALIKQADIVLVLTTDRTSVPRAACEAVEALRPLVLSDWPVLRELFPHAVFVPPSFNGVAAGIQDALERHSALVADAFAARDSQRRRWESQKTELWRHLLAGRTASSLDGVPGPPG